MQLARSQSLARGGTTTRSCELVCRASSSQHHPPVAPAAPRRSLLVAGAAALISQPLRLAFPGQASADELASSSTSAANALEIVDDTPGSGSAAAKSGDILLVHYVGTLAADGTLFDSTRGGVMYRDGGKGALRPLILRLGGPPVPGVCAGLQRGIEGMTVGGKRTFLVPPGEGFGAAPVLGPYGAVPGGSTLRYEVELLRLSRRGPDALMAGISQCGGGFVNERTAGCADIQPAEFV